jgi:hypothetical protein
LDLYSILIFSHKNIVMLQSYDNNSCTVVSSITRFDKRIAHAFIRSVLNQEFNDEKIMLYYYVALKLFQTKYIITIKIVSHFQRLSNQTLNCNHFHDSIYD